MTGISTINGVEWWESVETTLTADEEAVLDNPHASDADMERVLSAVRDRSRKPASSKDIAAAKAILDRLLPDGATLASFSVVLPDGCGVLNYGGHQVRF